MDFYIDSTPAYFHSERDRDALEEAHYVLSLWGRVSRLDRRIRIPSNTYIVMRWLEDHDRRRRKRHEAEESGEAYVPDFNLNRDYRSSRETGLIIYGVEQTLENKEAWTHYELQRRFLWELYYNSRNLYTGRFCAKLGIPRWKYKDLHIDSLRRFWLYY